MKLRFVSALLGVAQTALPSLARESSYLRRTNIFNFSDNSRCGNWEIVGDPIHGLSDYEYSGSSVAASADGSTVAIGAPYNSDAFIQQGSVRVHKFRDASNTWEQIGGNIIGSDVKELLGTSVALSGDGKIIAIGSTGHDRNLKNVGRVKVYQYVWYTNTWEKHGSWIFGQKSNEKFGFEVAISSDGSTLAASSSGQGMNTATTVYIFNEANAKWKEIGDSIEERGGGGVSVSLSDNGKVLAIGNRQSNTNAGQVRIFRQSENSSSLTQLGSTLYGNERDNCGASISLTGDGLMIAIGSDGFDNDRGRVEVFQFAEDIQDWKRKGPIILGEVEGSLAGTSVALSASGGLVAVGAIGKDRFGDESGHTASYIYDSAKSQWHRVGGSVHGEEKDDYAGGKVALSNDGLRLIVAAPFNSMQGIYSGLTRVFEFKSETCSPTISPTKSPIEPTVNPSVTPSATPSATPSILPSVLPSAASTRPSSSPTEFLAAQPTRIPTPSSSKSPTGAPSTTFEAYSPLWSFLDGWIR